MQRGYILNIYDPLNFDIGFEEEIDMQTGSHDVYQYTHLAAIESPEESSVKTAKSYRCHLKDLRFKANAKCHHDFGIAKKVLIQWSDYSDGHVNCKIHNIDTYNRLIVEIFDPFTLESYKTYLVQNFQTIFCIYQYSTPTVRLNEMRPDRLIPRPKSFQLPDFNYHF